MPYSTSVATGVKQTTSGRFVVSICVNNQNVALCSVSNVMYAIIVRDVATQYMYGNSTTSTHPHRLNVEFLIKDMVAPPELIQRIELICAKDPAYALVALPELKLPNSTVLTPNEICTAIPENWNIIKPKPRLKNVEATTAVSSSSGTTADVITSTLESSASASSSSATTAAVNTSTSESSPSLASNKRIKLITSAPAATTNSSNSSAPGATSYATTVWPPSPVFPLPSSSSSSSFSSSAAPVLFNPQPATVNFKALIEEGNAIQKQRDTLTVRLNQLREEMNTVNIGLAQLNNQEVTLARKFSNAYS